MWTEFGKLVLQATGLIVVVTLGIVWPVCHWGWGTEGAAIFGAAIACFIGSICSLIPVVVAVNHKTDWFVHACLGATMIRMLVTGAVAWIVCLVVLPSGQRVIFAVSVLIIYMCLLVWETLIVTKLLKRFYPVGKPKDR